MKKIFFLILIISIFGCKPKEIIITNEQVKEIVDFLASDELKGRDTGSEGIELSAQYLENKFKDYGVNPYYDTFRDNFKIDSTDAFNVVGFVEGRDTKLKDEIIIIGAHYDHVGFGKHLGPKRVTTEADSIANGANDNASGVAAVVMMASYFAKKKNNKRSIMFALFSAEEKGLLGSENLAKRLKDENIDLYTVICFEMIGVPFTDRDYVAFISGYDYSNMAQKINTYTNSNLIGKSDVAVKYKLFRRSDNYPFYEHFKTPSQSISSCDLSNYEFYHHVDDEADKMDYKHMTSLINKVIKAVEMMSNTAEKEIVMNENIADE